VYYVVDVGKSPLSMKIAETSQLVVHGDAQNTKAGHALTVAVAAPPSDTQSENMISLVFSRFSFRLLPAAHVCRCAISFLHVYVAVAPPGTTGYVSSANLKILLPS